MLRKIAVVLCGLAVMVAGSVSAHAQDDKAKIGDRLTAAGLGGSMRLWRHQINRIPSGILAGADPALSLYRATRRVRSLWGLSMAKALQPAVLQVWQVERAGMRSVGWWQLWISDWWTGDGPGADRDEPAGSAADAEEQVQARRGCRGFSRSGWA